jgi:long-chain acyl-CoA synthetase
MDIDLDLYRHEVRVSTNPLVRLSAIDISPDHPQRTFVFIHGFGGQAEQWHYQLQKFSVENRVIALDLRGHGLSDKPSRGYDMPQLVDDLETALTLLNVKGKFVLVGHSYGGAIVTEYALKNPDRVERLILMATAGEFKLQPMLKVALSLPNWLLRIIEPFTRKWLFAPPHVLNQLYFQNMAQWNGWERFSKLQVPTLVIRGNRDRVFESARFEKVTASIPGSLRRERPWLENYESGVPYTVGVPNIPLHHLLRSAVRRFPNRPASFFEGSRISYRRLNHEANRFANALISLGVGKSTRVVLLMPNVPQMVIGFYGTMKAGAAAVFVPPVIELEEIVREIKETEASVLVTLSIWAGLAKQIRDACGIPHVVLTDPADYLSPLKFFISRWRNRNYALPNSVQWIDLLGGKSSKSPTVGVAPEDLAVIQYTGGTTAQSKGVMLSHRNLVANALQTRHWLPEAVEGRERFLCVVPIFHSYGLTTAMNVPVSLGAAMILKPQFQVLDILKTIQRYQPTIFPGVPSMYMAINNFRGARKYGIKSIKACISGSAPLPVEVQEAFEKLTKGRLVEGYGLTEASPVTHANPLGEKRKVGTIGVPLPSTEAKIVDLAHRSKEVKQGQIGELAVRGPQVMMGYWKDPKATREVLSENGWLLTGDVAQCDEDGYFRIIARKADMWYPKDDGRQPAFPRDIEEVLYEVPQIKEVAVTAIAGRPFAFVIAGKEPPTAKSVIEYAKRRLPPHLVPRFVIFMEDFPRTFIGKVLRRELAKRYEQYTERVQGGALSKI